MKKLVFLLLLSVNLLQADWLYGGNDKCIKNYYFSKGTFYYQRSSNDRWYTVSNNNQESKIYSGYYYDRSTNSCLKDPKFLGLNEEHFNLVNGFIAVICVLGFIGTFFL